MSSLKTVGKSLVAQYNKLVSKHKLSANDALNISIQFGASIVAKSIHDNVHIDIDDFIGKYMLKYKAEVSKQLRILRDNNIQ